MIIRSAWAGRTVGIMAAAGAGALLRRGYLLATMAAVYKARGLCAGMFVCGRDAESVLAEDLDAGQHPVLRLIETRVDHAARQVTAGLLGWFGRTIRYEEGWGCVPVRRLRADNDAAAVSHAEDASRARRDAEDGWGVIVPPAAPRGLARLQAALDWAFDEPESSCPRRTRAVVVVHRGQLVGERYAPGFSAATPMLGWSLTKSVVNALVGILVHEGRLEVDQPAPIPAWRHPGDPRRRITVGQLLQMSSALRFSENYEEPLADVGYMLFAAPDMAAYAAGKPLEGEPGSCWSYSSGTSNILAGLIRQVVGPAEHASFPRRALFEPLGMTSAVIDRDLAGNFVCSSYMYASARDWARFGQLYLNDGVWAGRRILPRGWVDYSRTPAAAAPARDYGAHFWLQLPPTYQLGNARALPDDAFHAVGHEGQLITIIPSRELVVVRLGLTRAPAVWDHQAFVNRVLDALPAASRAPRAV